MSIAVRCRLCGRPYNLADRFAGQAVQCKECLASIQVPAAGQLAAGPYAGPRYDPPQQVAILVAEPVEAPKRPLPAPRPVAAVLASPLPVAPVLPAPLPAGPLAPLPGARRKKSQVPLILAVVGATALGLIVFVAVGFVAVDQLVPRAMSAAMASRAAARNKMDLTPAGSFRPSASNFAQGEELVQKLLASLQGLNSVLSQVVDGESARRLAAEASAKRNDLLALEPQITSLASRITPEEDRKLDTIYGAQFRSAVNQLKMNVMRVRQIQSAELAFGGWLPFEELHSRMGRLHGAGLRMGPDVSFVPPTPPSFQPPQAPLAVAPPTMPPHVMPPPMMPPHTGPRHTVPRPPITHPPMGPRHTPFNHGIRGPGAMHGRRGR